MPIWKIKYNYIKSLNYDIVVHECVSVIKRRPPNHQILKFCQPGPFPYIFSVKGLIFYLLLCFTKIISHRKSRDRIILTEATLKSDFSFSLVLIIEKLLSEVSLIISKSC